MRLFVDTATSDRWKYRSDDDEQQPFLVRLTWLLEQDDGNTIRDASHLVRLPGDVRMAGEAAHYTGIYDHQLQSRGLSLSAVLGEFSEALGEANAVVGHSWQHHKQVLERCYRQLGWPAREWPSGFCVMIKGAPFTKIPKMAPGGGWRWPTFDDCSEMLLGKPYVPSMDPVADGVDRVRTVRAVFNIIQSAPVR